ncbi:hypothetical protein [Bacillus sp. EB600]|uniref:hypothetical protein n=1 Tax=Bacillus sp. EB600 TaxID=2806345 RepID=UPI00210AF835|nr:hypothetical protein [Bacillus sp. EB600]MCQ6281528.1 hypothetical protein [Bacillus sp. EB600]
MKVKIVVLALLVFVLAGGGMAMAHGGDMKMPSTSSLNGSGNSTNSMQGMDMSGKDKNMDMSGSNQDGNMAGMDMGEQPIKETPPNVKVLGTYGAVNLSFIIIGVWNKWFRRKDGLDGNSK